MEGEVGKSQEVSPPCLQKSPLLKDPTRRWNIARRKAASGAKLPQLDAVLTSSAAKIARLRKYSYFPISGSHLWFQFARLIWDFMTTIGAWPTISAESCIWVSSTCANGLTTWKHFAKNTRKNLKTENLQLLRNPKKHAHVHGNFKAN